MVPRLGPWLNSYGVLVTIGALAGWWMARRRARRLDIDPSHVDLLVPVLLVAAAVGSRALGGSPGAPLWQRLLSPSPLHVPSLLAGAASASFAYALAFRIPARRLSDMLVVPAAVFLAIVRIGCFFGGCCWGDIAIELPAALATNIPAVRQVHTVPWLGAPWLPAVRFPPGSFAQLQHRALGLVDAGVPSLPVHPVQLYESALLVLLVFYVRRRERTAPCVPGATSGAMALGYCAVRALTEVLRADNMPVAGSFTMPQILSIGAGLVICAGMLLPGSARVAAHGRRVEKDAAPPRGGGCGSHC